MYRILLVLLALMSLAPQPARADGRALEIFYSANTYGYYDPCPG